MGFFFQVTDQPLAVFPVDTESGPAYVQNLLAAQGFRSMVTGGLRYADSKPGPCDCSYQVEGECRCHEVILLVYRADEPPLTLVLLCRGPWTCVYLCRSSISPSNQSASQQLVDLLVSDENEPDT